MSFCSVNELDKFSFEDCVLSKIEFPEGAVRMTLEALRVLPRNSQNTNFTESYAGTAELLLKNAVCLSVIREGYRYLDANGALVSEVPDLELPAERPEELRETLKESYLFSVQKDPAPTDRPVWRFRFEEPKEEEFDTLPTDSYELTFAFSEAVVRWDYYLNRVDR